MKKSSARAHAARRKPTSRRSSGEIPVPSQAAEGTRVEDRQRAVGAILAFYRRVRQKDRKALMDAAHISNPLLSRIEGGQRLPTREVLISLCKELGLTLFERSQLLATAGYEESKYSEVPESGPLFGDVLRGVPLFLRSPEDERKLALKSAVRDVWIVSPRPLILDTEFFKMQKTILLDDKEETKYVWFVDKQTGAGDASLIHERLDTDADLKEKEVDWFERIEFVLCPPALCIASPRMGIYNPRDEEKRFGRAIYVSEGRPVGLYSLDAEFVRRLAKFLMRMYDGCKSVADLPEPWFPREAETATMSGTFRLWRPKKASVVE